VSGAGQQEKGRLSLEISGKQIHFKGNVVRIACLEGEGYQFLEDPDAAVKALAKSDVRIDLFTFIQKLSDTTPCYGYPMEWDNMAAVPVSNFDQWMTHQIHSKVRTKIRKAAKSGVSVREVPFNDDLIRGISVIYNEMPIRQGMRFPHYKEDFETIRRTKSTFLDRSIFLGAFFEDRLIGFAKLVWDETGSQAAPMHILSMIRHRDKAPTNALVAQCVRTCAEKGISYLWYGKIAYRRKQGDSLAEFKQQNGFQRVDLPRYYVPLTVTGHVALRLGLHHGVADWIPEPVAAGLRRVRSFWYARRFAGLEGT